MSTEINRKQYNEGFSDWYNKQMQVYKKIQDKIENYFKKEYILYNQFLDELDFSVLPDGHFLNGVFINDEEVRRLYSEWQFSRKKNKNR